MRLAYSLLFWSTDITQSQTIGQVSQQVLYCLCLYFRCVRIFDLKEGGVQTLAAELRGHDGPVWQVAWANPR